MWIIDWKGPEKMPEGQLSEKDDNLNYRHDCGRKQRFGVLRKRLIEDQGCVSKLDN